MNDQGYDENDREQVEKGLSSTAIKELDLDLAKLARWACLAFLYLDFFIFVFLYLSQSEDLILKLTMWQDLKNMFWTSWCAFREIERPKESSKDGEEDGDLGGLC